jgi:methyl-accepting chemotaxis protein
MLGALSMAASILAIVLFKTKQYPTQWDRIADANTLEDYLSRASVVIDRSLGSLVFDGFLVAIVMFVLVGVAAFLYSHQITSPFNNMANQLSEIANGSGELSKRIDVGYKHDVGIMAAHLNRILEQYQQMMQRIEAQSERVAESSESLVVVARDLSKGTNSVNSRSSLVTNSVRALSEKISTVESSSRRISSNTESVVVSIEQLISSIMQLDVTASQASAISKQAETFISQNHLAHQRLGATTQEMGIVIDVLENLCERIHVLALNATLEAARSGDAGNGFSVVASEVKQLAKQTVDATETVVERISGIQEVSLAACHSMQEICKVIENVGPLSTAVASVFKEQKIISQGIFQAVRETSAISNSVASVIALTAIGTEEISLQIDELNEATLSTSQRAVRARDIGDELQMRSKSLQSLVGRSGIDINIS